MKRLCVILSIILLLSGCSAAQTFETIGDVYGEEPLPIQQEVVYKLPDNAMAQAIQSVYGQLYFCDGYEITLQTMTAGDLNKTLQELTGFGVDDLTVVETGVEEAARYECVWTSTGEGGDSVGRAVILDDGAYHYCMTAMAAEEKAAQLRQEWQTLFDSFILG